MLRRPEIKLPDTAIKYLKSPYQTPALGFLLLLGLLYERLNSLYYGSQFAIYMLISGLFALWLKLPRWIFYTILLLLFIRHVHLYTQNYARLDYDIQSTRDEAVEASARAFLDGKNPWNNVAVGPPKALVPASSGPASILFAVPAILLFNEINWLTLFFWMLFSAILLIGDLHEQNGTFPILILLFTAGIFHINITMQMSLDELYFPYLFVALAYGCIMRKRYFWAGFFIFITALFRLNFIFIIFGFLLWHYLNHKPSLHNLGLIALGGTTVTILVLLPFLLVGKGDFLQYNSFKFAFTLSGMSSWPENNVFFVGLNSLSRITGPNIMRFIKLLTTIGLMTLFSLRMRHLEHPFWHVTIGAFLAISIAWFPAYSPIDYELLPVLPAFMAVAFSPIKILTRNPSPPTEQTSPTEDTP